MLLKNVETSLIKYLTNQNFASASPEPIGIMEHLLKEMLKIIFDTRFCF